MIYLLEQLGDFFQSQALRYSKWQADKKLGQARSPEWRITVREFAKIHPKICSILACKKKDIELHHIIPFHIDPSKENDFTNLMWFCRTHHHQIPHLFDWKSYYLDVREFVRRANEKIASRP